MSLELTSGFKLKINYPVQYTQVIFPSQFTLLLSLADKLCCHFPLRHSKDCLKESRRREYKEDKKRVNNAKKWEREREGKKDNERKCAKNRWENKQCCCCCW